MKIEIRDFSGIAPRYSPELLADNTGQAANNLSIKSGKIHPEKPFTILAPDRDYVPGQVNDDQYNRLYFLAGGTLCMYGNFPVSGGTAATSAYVVRVVDMTTPGTVTLTAKSSPLLDAVGHLNDGQMVFNYNSNSWKKVENIACHIYSARVIDAIDGDWTELADGTLTRSFYYNPNLTVILWPQGHLGG